MKKRQKHEKTKTWQNVLFGKNQKKSTFFENFDQLLGGKYVKNYFFVKKKGGL